MKKKIAPDKWKHFFVGIPLGAALEFAAWYFFPLQPLFSTAMALIVLLVICYGFELFSRITGKGNYEMMDAIAGVIGGLIGMGATWIFL